MYVAETQGIWAYCTVLYCIVLYSDCLQ